MPKLSQKTVKKLTEAFCFIEGLKTIKRQGWILKEVHDPESVADHTYATASLCMLLGDALRLNTHKLIRMALVHDLAESIIWDWKWETGKNSDYEKQQIKHRQEHLALKKIFGLLGKKGDKYFLLWEEFEQQKTAEAKAVKQIEKIEMALQALLYEKTTSADFNEFFENAEKYVNDPELLKFLKYIQEMRKQQKIEKKR